MNSCCPILMISDQSSAPNLTRQVFHTFLSLQQEVRDRRIMGDCWLPTWLKNKSPIQRETLPQRNRQRVIEEDPWHPPLAPTNTGKHVLAHTYEHTLTKTRTHDNKVILKVHMRKEKWLFALTSAWTSTNVNDSDIHTSDRWEFSLVAPAIRESVGQQLKYCRWEWDWEQPLWKST